MRSRGRWLHEQWRLVVGPDGHAAGHGYAGLHAAGHVRKLVRRVGTGVEAAS